MSSLLQKCKEPDKRKTENLHKMASNLESNTGQNLHWKNPLNAGLDAIFHNIKKHLYFRSCQLSHKTWSRISWRKKRRIKINRYQGINESSISFLPLVLYMYQTGSQGN